MWVEAKPLPDLELAVAVALQGREVTNGLSSPWTLTDAVLPCWIQALAHQKVESSLRESSVSSCLGFPWESATQEGARADL